MHFQTKFVHSQVFARLSHLVLTKKSNHHANVHHKVVTITVKPLIAVKAISAKKHQRFLFNSKSKETTYNNLYSEIAK